VAALAAVLWLAGCGGGGGSLPTDSKEGPTPPDTGGPALPGDPVEPTPSSPPQPPPPGLWPLTTGSTWTYQIRDETLGDFKKTVTVLGASDVPELSPPTRAVLVHSVQLRNGMNEVYEEESWQLELTNGLVVRLREQDYRDRDQNPTPIRVTRWLTPGTHQAAAIMKSLSREQPVDWQHTDTLTEVTRIGGEPEESKEHTFLWKVVGMESVTVPAGTFPNALKVVRTRQGKELKERTYWLVPGVGKVKEEGERAELLESYDVKK
jgi:hypothetical protein